MGVEIMQSILHESDTEARRKAFIRELAVAASPRARPGAHARRAARVRPPGWQGKAAFANVKNLRSCAVVARQDRHKHSRQHRRQGGEMSNIMDDLGELIFGDDLANEAMFRGAALEHGAILDRRFEQGRPGVAGEVRPREGSADHGTVYIRTSEGAFSSGKASYPKVGEVIQVKETRRGFEPWRIRLKRPKAACLLLS